MSHLIHRRLRAPQEDGAALIDPPLSQAPSLLADNRAKADRWDQISGVPFAKWRYLAREDLVALCDAQTRPGWPLGNEALPSHPAMPTASQPFILSGHQPSLFHPGVWLKNFLLSAIGERIGGATINLIIDNDVVSSPGINIPTGTKNDPSLVHVPFDKSVEAIPWEVTSVSDLGFFSSFAKRVKEAYPIRPKSGFLLLDQVWDHAVRIAETELEEWGWIGPRLMGLGDCLAGARHRVELDLGLKTFEAPLHLLVGPPFRDFADLLFSRAREFLEIYNTALREYRIVNRIRSRSHPVPEIEIDGDWVEVPFWIWTIDNRRRRRAFVRNTGADYELSDRQGLVLSRGWNSWDGPHRDASPRLRPRALITTMYARLVLSDLFIHGIGGAKYDELTDLIIRRFFGIEPPAYITATSTFRLPIDRPKVSLDDVRSSAGRIRELRYRPESFLRDPLVIQDAHLAPQLASLAAEKQSFLDQHDLRHCSQDVFDKLDAMNRAMHDRLHSVEQELRARHADLITLAKQSQLLGSREFSFVLFPSEILPVRLLDLCKVMS